MYMMVSFDTYDVIFRQNQLCTKKEILIDLRLVYLPTTSLYSLLLLLTSLFAPIVIQMTWDIAFWPIATCFYRDYLNLGTTTADQMSIFGRPNRCIDTRKGLWLRYSRKRRSDPGLRGSKKLLPSICHSRKCILFLLPKLLAPLWK